MPTRCIISYSIGWWHIPFSFNRLVVILHQKEIVGGESIDINNVWFFLFITYTEKVGLGFGKLTFTPYVQKS